MRRLKSPIAGLLVASSATFAWYSIALEAQAPSADAGIWDSFATSLAARIDPSATLIVGLTTIAATLVWLMAAIALEFFRLRRPYIPRQLGMLSGQSHPHPSSPRGQSSPAMPPIVKQAA